MSQAPRSSRQQLVEIARRAMTERGLLPDFSAEAKAQLSGIHEAAPGGAQDTRDLRTLRDHDRTAELVITDGAPAETLHELADLVAAKTT